MSETTANEPPRKPYAWELDSLIVLAMTQEALGNRVGMKAYWRQFYEASYGKTDDVTFQRWFNAERDIAQMMRDRGLL